MSNPNTATMVAERDQLREKVAEIEAEVELLERKLGLIKTIREFAELGAESKRLRNVIIESAKLLRSIEIHVCMDTWPDELRDRFYKALEILCDVQEEDDRG
jgi:hypothetical protein